MMEDYVLGHGSDGSVGPLPSQQSHWVLINPNDMRTSEHRYTIANYHFRAFPP